MDSNVVGRYYTGPTGVPPSIQRIVVRDLTEATEGNAVGIGMADVALRRAVEKIDRRKTYMNGITAKTPEGARIPLTVDTDREALVDRPGLLRAGRRRTRRASSGSATPSTSSCCA